VKKILILAHDFPPKQSVGAERPFGWYKYLPKYGFDPTVVTINQDSITIEQKRAIDPKNSVFWTEPNYTFRDKFILKYGSRYALLRRFLSLVIFLFEFVSFKFDSKRGIYFEAHKLLQKQKFDIIIATGEPFILFKYASLLSNEFGVPWIADYRDEWVKNPTVRNKVVLFFTDIYKIFFERKYLKNVTTFTTVNNDIKKNTEIRTKVKMSRIIENGVDLDIIEFKNYKPEKSNDFIIAYAGILYDFDYLKIFSAAFDRFMKDNQMPKNVKIHFYGIRKQKSKAIDDAEKLNLKYPKNVFIFDFLEIKKLASEISKASLFLNLIAADPSKGNIGTKIYLYAALRKPVLSIPSLKISESNFFPNRNIHFISFKENEIFDYLNNLYLKFVTGESIITDITDEEVFNLSREKSTANLSQLLLSIINENKIRNV
jgi:hypothetical protein